MSFHEYLRGRSASETASGAGLDNHWLAPAAFGLKCRAEDLGDRGDLSRVARLQSGDALRHRHGLSGLRASSWSDRVAGLAAMAVGVAAMLQAFGRMTTPRQDPLDPTLRVVFFAECAAAVLVASALVAPRVETALRRHAVTRIVGALDEAPAPDVLERTLGGGLGDPGLRLVFSLPEDGRCVDSAGRPCDRPAAAHGRVVTPLVRTGEPVAWIDHEQDCGNRLDRSPRSEQGNVQIVLAPAC